VSGEEHESVSRFGDRVWRFKRFKSCSSDPLKSPPNQVGRTNSGRPGAGTTTPESVHASLFHPFAFAKLDAIVVYVLASFIVGSKAEHNNCRLSRVEKLHDFLFYL
jgi:hypothetical protein